MSQRVDSFGPYTLFTGNEAPGHCFWCGAGIKRNRRYCSDEHRDEYYKHFCWPDASRWCLERHNRTCADCGGRATIAHHIEPLNGQPRLWSILNRPENLVALCASCHQKRPEHNKAPTAKVRRGKGLRPLAFLSNARVAWQIPPSRIAQFYLWGVYLCPLGWTVLPQLDTTWMQGECGEFRKIELLSTMGE